MIPKIDLSTAAILTIDLHRGHLDPAVATMPLSADAAQAVIAANQKLVAAARAAGVPVVHMLTSYRNEAEVVSNPFWASIADTTATRGSLRRHQLEGGPGLEIMPEVMGPGDWVVDTKKRYDCFLGTDLEFVLRAHGIKTLFITGVNTNSCVLTTTIEAMVRDYACIVVDGCVDTMDGDEFHRMGLKIIERAFGWVASTDEAVAVLSAA